MIEIPGLMDDAPAEDMGLVEEIEQFGFDGEMEAEETRSPDDPGVSMEELGSIIKQQVDEAISYSDETLAPQRETAQEFYDGEFLPGDNCLDATRSRVVSRDVHDTIKAILPSVIRAFFTGKNAVVYDPTGPEQEMMAQQATDYVNDIVLQKDNDAFDIFYDVFWDALTKGLGPVMWYWDDEYDVVGQEYTGLNEQEFMIVSEPQMPGVEVTDVEVTGQYETLIPGPQGPAPAVLMDCKVTYKILKGGKIKLAAVPPEERLISENARCIDEAPFYGRRRILTVSEVVAMGYDYNQVVSMGGASDLETNEEAVERYGQDTLNTTPASPDPAMRTLEYIDGYLKVDLDGDGFAEQYHIAVGGNARELLRYKDGTEALELVEGMIPYAEFCPDPVPHSANGHSVSNAVMDIQRTKSNLLRGTLDSLSRSIFPREEVVQNQVNMDDVLSTEIGAVIRTKAPGMIREITTPFMGKEALPILGYMDEVKADRTGISDATMGLDPGAMQSTAEAGINAAVSASQMQIEMITRIFAKSGMTRVFKGILKLIKTHQDKIRTVKLKGEWVPVNPAFWDVGMDATVNTALGRGTEQQRMMTMNMISQKQAEILEKMGPMNGVVSMVEYRNTLAEMVELAGYPNADRFFLPITHQEMIQKFQGELQQAQQQAQELGQQNSQLQWELKNHSAAEDEKNAADAFTKTTTGIKNIVDAAQTAAQVTVPSKAVQDEFMAVAPFMPTPPVEPPGSQGGPGPGQQQ